MHNVTVTGAFALDFQLINANFQCTLTNSKKKTDGTNKEGPPV
jgi:hypothetical protein